MLCLEYSLNYLQVLLCMCKTLLVEYIIYDQSWWAFIVGTMQLPVLAKYSSANCQWTSTSGGHTQVTLGKTTSHLMSYYVWFTNSQSSFLYGLRVVSGCNTYIYIFKKNLWRWYMTKQHNEFKLKWPNHHLSGCRPIFGNHQNSVVGIVPNAVCMLHEIAIEKVLQGSQWWDVLCQV